MKYCEVLGNGQICINKINNVLEYRKNFLFFVLLSYGQFVVFAEKSFLNFYFIVTILLINYQLLLLLIAVINFIIINHYYYC